MAENKSENLFLFLPLHHRNLWNGIIMSLPYIIDNNNIKFLIEKQIYILLDASCRIT